MDNCLKTYPVHASGRKLGPEYEFNNCSEASWLFYVTYDETISSSLFTSNETVHNVCTMTFDRFVYMTTIVSQDSFSLWTRARAQTARSTAYFNGCHYFIYPGTIVLLYMYAHHVLWPLRFDWLSVLSLYKEDYLHF